MTWESDGLPPPTVPALVYRLARSSTQHIAADFAAHGMPDLLPRHALQLFVLLTTGGMRMSDLATRLGVTRQATAQVVTTLERGGYVTRLDDPGDRRARLICLTARGRSALRVLRHSLETIEQDWEQTLGPARLADLRNTLTTLEHGEGGFRR